MKNTMSAVFLQYDQEKMIQKYALEHDEKYLYIDFVGRAYRIDRLSGSVSWSDNSFWTEETAGYNEVMTIYDVLCHSKENCCLSGEWVNVGSLSSVRGGSLAKGGNFFQSAGEAFDGKADRLSCACECLRGKKIKKGDVGYELELFPFLPVVLCFWDSDEDFKASMQILTDKNILDYMHYETLMFAVTHLLNRIKSEMEADHKT